MCAHPGKVGLRHAIRQCCLDGIQPFAIASDQILKPVSQLFMAQEPDRGAAQQALQVGIEAVLHTAGNARIERINLPGHLEKIEAVAGNRVGCRNVGGFCRRLACYQCHEARAAAIDHAVGQHGGDDLAAQAVIVDVLAEALLHGLGEIAPELAGEIGIIGNVAGHDLAPAAQSWHRRAARQARAWSVRRPACRARG